MNHLALIALLAACGSRAEQPAESLATLPAAPVAVARTFDLPAVFTSTTAEILPAPFAARIKLHVIAGQRVHKGDPIATFDTAELTGKLTGARAEERAARSDAGAAAVETRALGARVANQERLHRFGVLSGTELEATRKDYAAAGNRAVAAGSRAEAAAATRNELERKLGLATITAPFDGIVAEVAAHEGEVPAVGARIAQIVEPDHLIVRFALPTGFELATGERVEVTSDDLAHSVWATVTQISRERAPINFSVVEAGIADRDRADLQVASIGHVRIAYAGVPR